MNAAVTVACQHMSPSHYQEETFDLTADGRLPDSRPHLASKYQDGSSIDWLSEELLERERTHAQRAHRGIRGLLLPWRDSAQRWFIIVTTGIGIGLAGAWLDVLVKWLSDLREGRCTYGFFYNQVACCSGLNRACCRAYQTQAACLTVNSSRRTLYAMADLE